MNKTGNVNYLNIGSRIEKLGLTKIPPSTNFRNLLGCSVLSHSLTGVCGSLMLPNHSIGQVRIPRNRYNIVSNKCLLFRVT